MPNPEEIAAIVLAGGRGRRMDERDKGLVALAGRPLAAWVCQRLADQVDELVISANRNLGDYAALGHPVVTDDLPGQPGPLAGILAAATRTTADWLLVVPCDTPFLPADLAARLLYAAHTAGTSLTRAADPERSQYAIMLLNRRLLPDLAATLATGKRRVQDWQARHQPAEVHFEEAGAFFNVNSPDDLRQAEAMLASWVTLPT